METWKTFLLSALCMSAVLEIYAENPAQTTTPDPETYDLGSVLVEGSRVSKYRTDEVVSSTFFPVAPEKVPVSVDVMTEDFIREQNAGDLHDLLFSNPSVYGGGKSLLDRTAGQYTIRGKSGSSPTLDGVVPLTSGMGMLIDPNAFERIEIVKGPIGSLIGGQTSTLGAYGAGGSINMIQKKPDPMEDFTDVNFSAGFGKDSQLYRFTGDSNYRLGDGYYIRIPVSIETGRDFWLPYGNEFQRSIFLAPSFLWEKSDRLRFVVNTTFQYLDSPAYQGIPTYRGKPLAPYSWDSYPPEDLGLDLRDEYSAFSISGYAEWDATDVWQFRAGGAFLASDIEFEHLSAQQYASQSGKPVLTMYEQNMNDSHDKVWSVYGRSTAQYDVLNTHHTTMLQADYMKTDKFSYSASRTDTTKDTFYYLPKGTPSSRELDRVGATVQQYVEWGIVNALAGIRADRHESNLGNTADSYSPRIGLSVAAMDNLIFYGNLSRTEAPNFGYMSSENTELDSSWNADEWEAGVRFSPVGTLWLSLAYYDITQENTPEYDGGTGYYTTRGCEKNNGVELSLSGNISDNWTVYAGYAYNNKRFDAGEKHYDSMPPHAITFQTSYTMSAGRIKDLKLGMGIRYKHGYDATFRGEYLGPDYFYDSVTVVDISAELPLSNFGGSEKWSLRLGINNLFDKDYFSSTRHYYQSYVGDPRTFHIAVRGRF